ncbi:MAG: sigma-70 family RNA polymerase sigma factor [Verrucomicrobia bacterium]|nr:sigma-70 family RNA polymerase sigma factor [Verrucomicrobiota bacterium]
MTADPSIDRTPSPGADYFATTHWSLVLTAQHGNPARAHEALSVLCRTYWYPLYAFVRRQGHGPHDAQDLTQEFFARLLAKNYLADVAREKGKLRSFLLAALKHFLANEWDRARAAKRGGAQAPISLDDTDAETRYLLEPADVMSADRIFERRWALTLLDQVLRRLRTEQADAGKLVAYEQLKPCLTGPKESAPYAELATKLGMTEGAVKVAAHRLRRRYRELLREEIAQTVASPAEVDDEIRHIIAVLSG